MKKAKILVIIILIVFLLCTFISCRDNSLEVSIISESELTDSVPIKESVKYIFIVIGDGMGQTHFEMGNLFKKIVTGHMSAQGAWDLFPVHITAIGGEESSQGGSMIATGEMNPVGFVSQRENGKELTTILDIAKANGLSTGVITMASIADATPATFFAHSGNRYDQNNVVEYLPGSNVDFIAGGGLELMFKNLPIEFQVDSSSNDVSLDRARNDIALKMEQAGYNNYLGLYGALNFLSEDKISGKTFFSFSNFDAPYYYDQLMPLNADIMKNTPSLPEITKKGIENLYDDPDGFCMVLIEEAHIDKAGHLAFETYAALEMGIMDKTLETILDFYIKHPNETLVILTADHEIGNHRHGEGVIDSLSSINERLPWDGSTSIINNYLFDNFNTYVANEIIDIGITYIEQDKFGNDFDNRAITAANITYEVGKALGLVVETSGHSKQPIPIYAIGNGSKLIGESKTLSDIPHYICDIMEWDDILGK